MIKSLHNRDIVTEKDAYLAWLCIKITVILTWRRFGTRVLHGLQGILRNTCNRHKQKTASTEQIQKPIHEGEISF